jgi:hypothetical protein
MKPIGAVTHEEAVDALRNRRATVARSVYWPPTRNTYMGFTPASDRPIPIERLWSPGMRALAAHFGLEPLVEESFALWRNGSILMGFEPSTLERSGDWILYAEGGE